MQEKALTWNRNDSELTFKAESTHHTPNPYVEPLLLCDKKGSLQQRLE
jgi:hypothetical protein